MTLAELGWDEARAAAFDAVLASRRGGPIPRVEPARVAVHHRNHYLVYAEGGEVAAVARGRFRADRPVTGDWVAIARSGSRDAVIEATLPRRTRFSRKVAGKAVSEQVIAANIDMVWVVTGADLGRNARRIERYLTLAWESGAQPAVIVTKVDLAPLAGEAERELRAAAAGVPLIGVSNVTGEGIADLAPFLGAGRTIALLGASGVGKSTLVNRLVGDERQEVCEVRMDGKGRHTTTRRELVLVPGGGLLLDTPGMRELALWDADEGLAATFEDIETLAPECRFRDCRHRGEPGCAVEGAVERGEIPAERLASYRKLDAEREDLGRRRAPHGSRARRGREGGG